MSVQFCVLGSGSKGNAALVMTPELHVMIDAGFAPEELEDRMEGTGASWHSLDALILTHVHGDHIKKRCLARCAEHKVHFICHERHAAYLAGGRFFHKVKDKGLLHTFSDKPLVIRAGDTEQGARIAESANAEGNGVMALQLTPIPLSHDARPTFGFRLEARSSQRTVALAYLADLGEWNEDVLTRLADVDLLALEFNHDEEMELSSGRHPLLIERVLGAEGHLSNVQAAEAFRRVLQMGRNGGPKYLVQLHLSDECNLPRLAYDAAYEVVKELGASTQVFSTRQQMRGTIYSL
jgi:phosphoribosyl 1,2-cyclic phosphodiesterase